MGLIFLRYGISNRNRAELFHHQKLEIYAKACHFFNHNICAHYNQQDISVVSICLLTAPFPSSTFRKLLLRD